MTTLPGFTPVAMEEASSRDCPAAQTTFSHRRMSRVSISMRTRGGTLSAATPTGRVLAPGSAEILVKEGSLCLNSWHLLNTFAQFLSVETAEIFNFYCSTTVSNTELFACDCVICQVSK